VALERPLGAIGFMFGIKVRHQAEGFEVAREFVEVETGKGADALDVGDPINRAPTEFVGSKSEFHMTGKIQHVVSMGFAASRGFSRRRFCVCEFRKK